MDRIYLDNHATTPIDPLVLEAMMPFLTDKFGNVASSHWFGRQVASPVQNARCEVAALINAKPQEIVFTSGATEADNLAIKGVCASLADEGRHIITCATEHKAVLDTCSYLQRLGFEVTVLGVDRYGQIEPDDLAKAIRTGARGTTQRTILVSIMHANNEVGTVHPVEAMGKICKEAGVVFHVDAAQSAGRLIIDVRAASIDLLSLSGHKMYGPKGIGALFVRSGDPALRIEPQIHGGGQEKGLRSGTLAVALIVGFGKAAELALKLREQDSIHALELREALLEILKASCQNIVINGHPIRRLPGNLHVTLTGVDAEILLLKAGAVACSTTSACSTGSSAPSHVLKAIGLGDQAILSSLRLGVGRFTTAEEIQQAGRLLAAAFQQSAKAMA